MSSSTEFAIHICCPLLFSPGSLIESIIVEQPLFSALPFSRFSLRIAFAVSTKSTGNKTIRAVIHFMICVRCYFQLFDVVRFACSSQHRSSVTRTRLCPLLVLFFFHYFIFSSFFSLDNTTIAHIVEYKSLTSNINQMKYVRTHRERATTASALALADRVVCSKLNAKQTIHNRSIDICLQFLGERKTPTRETENAHSELVGTR